MGTPDPSGGGQKSNTNDAPRPFPFGKYVLLDRVSVGGMAEVYRAKSFGVAGFEKVIAIKRILPGMVEETEFIDMFIDEAKIAGQLSHSNICSIYELGKVGNAHYIALEYIWGKDLLQIINRFRRMRKHMPPAMVAWIGAKICEGLDYAHRKLDSRGNPLHIVHRDMSPQNVLVSYEGNVKIIDFGIAKAASRTTTTRAGVLKGKFGYMSPEQVRSSSIDARSDLFAVGTCMHEMATGERLFLGESDIATLERVRHARAMPPSHQVPGFPAELEAIIMRALKGDLKDRWQSAREMQEALQHFLASEEPPFGDAKLSAWMKTAFANEMATEKERAQHYQSAAAQISSSRTGSSQAPLPMSSSSEQPTGIKIREPDAIDAVATRAGRGGRSGEETPSHLRSLHEEATAIGTSPQALSDDPNGEASSEPTQIFFNSGELERELTGGDMIHDEGEGSQPPPPIVIPPIGGTLPQSFAMQPNLAAQASAAFTKPASQASTLGFTPTPSQPPPPTTGQSQVRPQFPQMQPINATPMPAPSFAQPTPPPQAIQPEAQFAHAPPAAAAPTPQFEQQSYVPSVPPSNAQPAAVAAPLLSSMPMSQTRMIAAGAGLFVLGMIVGAVSFSRADFGTLEVRVAGSQPARVFLDGVDKGPAPLRLDRVTLGQHLVIVSNERGASARQMTQVTAQGMSNVLLALPSQDSPNEPARTQPSPSQPAPAVPNAAAPRPSESVAVTPTPSAPRVSPTQASPSSRPATTGALNITSVPWSRVFLDERDSQHNTPWVAEGLAPGPHTIGLRRPDGTRHSVRVMVVAGETRAVAHEF